MGPVGDFSDLLFLVLVLVLVAVVKSFFLFFSVSWVSSLLGGLVG